MKDNFQTENNEQEKVGGKKMPRVITLDHINETKFYQVPKAFFHNPLYIDMKNEAKLAYALLRDLLDLSIKNNWINEKNEVFVKLSRDKMMNYLHIKGTAKYAEIMKELTDKDLILKRRVGLNRIDETYVCIPEELAIVYSDEELLKKEKEDDSNEVIPRTFENQTSRGSKIKRPEVSKSNVQTFDNQTHTNTKYTNTNSINTNSTISNNSSKGEKDSPLVDSFQSSICELKKTTLPKFMVYVEKYQADFIEAIIAYGESVNAKSYSWFEKTIEAYIAKGFTTGLAVDEDIQAYKNKAVEAKNRALKQKEEKRKASEEAHARDMAGYAVVANDDLADIENVEVDITSAVPADDIREFLRHAVGDLYYNSYIKTSEVLRMDNRYIIKCPNEFTVTIIERKLIDKLNKAIKLATGTNAFLKIISQ